MNTAAIILTVMCVAFFVAAMMYFIRDVFDFDGDSTPLWLGFACIACGAMALAIAPPKPPSETACRGGYVHTTYYAKGTHYVQLIDEHGRGIPCDAEVSP